MTRYSAPFARLGKIRSAGVTDLRFGNVIDEHWQGRNRFELGTDARTPVPLPTGVDCYTIAAEHDGLVPLASAMGEHPNPALRLDFPPSRRFDHVGVVVGQLERGRPLLGDVLQGGHRGSNAEEESRDASAQPQRFGDAAGQLPP